MLKNNNNKRKDTKNSLFIAEPNVENGEGENKNLTTTPREGKEPAGWPGHTMEKPENPWDHRDRYTMTFKKNTTIGPMVTRAYAKLHQLHPSIVQ